MSPGITAIFRCNPATALSIPCVLARVPAGFPSPADDYIESRLDLNTLLIQHQAATFFVRVTGNSMQQAGIASGDLLIVDRALRAKNGDIVIAVLDGGLTVKKLELSTHCVRLLPANADYRPIVITEGNDFEVWGVVTHVIRSFSSPGEPS